MLLCRERVLVFVACVLITAAFHYEVVFLNRTIVPLIVPGVMPNGAYPASEVVRPDPFRPDLGASAWQVMGWIRKVHDEYERGALPIWNDHQGFGTPLLGNAISGAIDPTLLPIYFNGSPESWDAYYVLRTLAGLLVTYIYARQIGLVPLACLYFAVAYVFSGHLVLFNNNTWITGYLTLPAILLGTEYLQNGAHARGLLITALSIALSLVNGMPEVSLFVLVFAAIYAAIGLLTSFVRYRLSARFTVLLRYEAVAWLIGLSLAAPLLFSLAEYVSLASRTSERVNNGLMYTTVSHLVALFVPYINGRPLDPGYNFAIVHYVGAATIPLALLGLTLPQSHALRRMSLVFLTILVLFLAKMVGAPIVNDIGAYPPFTVAIFTKWAAPVAGFALVALGAIGVHVLTTMRTSLSVALAVLTGSLAILLLGMATFYDRAPSIQHPLFYNALAVLVVVGMGLSLLAGRTRFRSYAATCAVAIATLELFLLSPHDVYADRYDWFAPSPYLTFLQQDHEQKPFRVFSGDNVLFPNTSSSFGIDDIRAVEALYPARYMAYIQTFLNTSIKDRFTGSPLWSTEAVTPISGNPWFDLTGVRYVLARPNSPTTVAAESDRVISSLDGAAVTCPPSVPRACATIDWAMINGLGKTALIQQGPSTVSLPVHVPVDRSYLTFSIGMPPDLWDTAKGDGVSFELRVDAKRGSQGVFRKQIDPKNRPADRRWYPAMADLGQYAGQDVTLHFVVSNRQDSSNDLALWGDVELDSGEPENLFEQPRGISCTPRADACGKSTRVTFDQVTRAAYKVDLGSTVRKRFLVDEDHTFLTFAPLLTMSPSDTSSDGNVVFRVDVNDVTSRENLESRSISRQVTSRPHWDYTRVDLSRYVGRDVEVALSTATSVAEASGITVMWGDVHIGRGDEQYVKLYDNEVVIYQNLLAAPRAFLVGEAVRAADMTEAREIMGQRSINPRETAVLEAPAEIVLPDGEDVRGSVQVVDRTATSLMLDVTTDRPAIVVVTDSFYPGWQASVDGRTAPIYATDVAFQGVVVEAGQHRVVFTYRPMSVTAGVLTSVAGAGTLAVILGLLGLANRRRRTASRRSAADLEAA